MAEPAYLIGGIYQDELGSGDLEICCWMLPAYQI